MSARIISTLCGAAAVALSTSVLYAAPVVIVDDQFNDGDRTNGVDSLDTEWYASTNGTPSFLGVDGNGRFKLENSTFSSTGFNPVPTTTFPSVTLATGDKIRVSFESVLDASSAGSPIGSFSSNLFRFGLFNSGGTTLATDLIGFNNLPGTGTTFNDDLGYTVYAPSNQAGTVELRARNVSNVNNNLAISGAAHSSPLPGSAAVGAIAAGTPTDHVLELTRTASGYDYYVEHAGVSFTGSTATVTTSTFDQFQMIVLLTARNEATQSFAIDNFKIEYTAIPEPASLSLLALSGVAALRRRRR